MMGSHPYPPRPEEAPDAMSACWPPRTDEDLAACRLGYGIRLHTSAEVISRLPETGAMTSEQHGADDERDGGFEHRPSEAA